MLLFLLLQPATLRSHSSGITSARELLPPSEDVCWLQRSSCSLPVSTPGSRSAANLKHVCSINYVRRGHDGASASCVCAAV